MPRKMLPLFFLVLLVSGLVNAQESVNASATVDLNVTLVNAGPFYKFVLINPDYNYTLFRKDGDIGIVNTLGFWIAPYETLQVNVKINEPLSTGTISGVEGPNIFYSPIYPQLILYPQKYYAVDTFFISDGYVKVLKYSGSVKVTIENPSPGNSKYIAIGLPVLFEGAEMSDFTPEYTMKYSEYVDTVLSQYAQYVREYIPEYLNGTPEGSSSSLSELSSRIVVSSGTGLLAGSKEEPELPRIPKKPELKFDYPVWIVFLGNKFEITYSIKWENLMRVSEFGGEKEKTFRLIMDRRDLK
ncbi:hypothetical protein ADU37_CDS20920 [Thermococcus sp. 2319x1]|uniref:hypothetical protein n=1 Tax=Thermococcus sp. 2319x1 TaxID=1674923 RepID=UPI00073A98BD|nr:hypothetical protein [Thermococcus sp. 2319x1]ALV63789.1 hypothetical protein ADU37_CDS20920 [Thermococcus sp. 2319x1]